MDFRRNGLRDERRRRVLMEETLHGGESDDGKEGQRPTDSERSPTKSYSDAAIASSQVPVSFLLPKHPFITWAVWLTGLAMIAGIELLYRYVFLNATDGLRDSLTALDVTERGSLASWFGTVVLGSSAFGSLLVFQIRRHRTDDYRGRYRWWLWLVPLLLLLSVSAATGLHEVLAGVLTSLTGARVAVGGKGWWLLGYTFLFFPIVLQLAIEFWPSRLATLFYFTTVAMYVSVALFELSTLRLTHPLVTTICHSSLLLAAHLGVLVTILAYGRYVYLDAHSRLIPRQKWLKLNGMKMKMKLPKLPRFKLKRKKKKPAAATDAQEKPVRAAKKEVRVDEAHAKPGQEHTAPNFVLNPPQKDDDEYDDDDDSDEDRRQSRGERRRNRKETQRGGRS